MESINDDLRGAINQIIYTSCNVTGRLTEIVYDIENDPQYAIIATNYFAGSKERYFAIPVLQAFFEVTTNGNVVFDVTENDLILARRIRFEDCPTIRENDFFPSIYEVYAYEAPQEFIKKKAI